MKQLIASTFLILLAGFGFSYNLPQPEAYFRAVSPIFAYDPVYGLLIGGAWFSYPTGNVDDAKTTQDLNFISSLSANGAINYGQTNPNVWHDWGYRFHIGGNNFYDYSTVKNSNEIDETFTATNLQASVDISHQLTDKWSALGGIRAQWNHHQRDGSLKDSYFSSALIYDNRDDAINSHSGLYLQQTVNYQHPALSQSWDKSGGQLKLDARLFKPVGNQKTFAIKGLLETSVGSGFSSEPGGSELLRGYLPGQYSADSMLAVQTEFRFPIWSFIRGVTFAEAAHLIDEQEETLASAGLGFRFGLPPDQSISIRWDNAVNQHGQWLSYVNFNQVF